MGNPAGWDNNANIDEQGISLLNLWISRDPQRRFRSTAKANDNEANFDGYIEYGEPHDRIVVPVGRINIQVKSTEGSLINENTSRNIGKYKYECKTGILFAASQEISKDPAALVIVDVHNEQLYWISLKRKYLNDLDLRPEQKSKTLYFDDSNLMNDYDKFFSLLEEFVASHVKFRETLSNGVALLDESISQERRIELEDLSDILNDRCRDDLFFLKESTFPDAWKMAIRYEEKGDQCYLGITPLSRGTNNTLLIGGLRLRDTPSPFYYGPLTSSYEDDPFMTICCDLNRSLSQSLDEMVGKWTEKLESVFVIPPAIMPDIMLEELFFWYVDLLATIIPGIGKKEQSHIFPADVLDPDECRRLLQAPYYAAWKRWMSYSQYVDFDPESTYCADPFSRDPALNDLEKSCADIKEFIEIDSLTYEADFRIELNEAEIPFMYLRKVLEEIERRNITLKRPWKLSLSENQNSSTRSEDMLPYVHNDKACNYEDYEMNLRKLYCNYSIIRSNLLSSFFGSSSFDEFAYRKEITVFFDEKNYCETVRCYSHE